MWVLNLLFVLTSFKRNGAKLLPSTKSGEFFVLFWKSEYTVSCAKNGTSWYLLLSLSVTEIISNTGLFSNAILLYFSAAPNDTASVTIVPLTALACFFNNHFVMFCSSSTSKISCSLGLIEPESLNTTSSIVLNIVPLVDVTSIPAKTFIQ